MILLEFQRRFRRIEQTILFALASFVFVCMAVAQTQTGKGPVRIGIIGLVHSHVHGFWTCYSGNQEAYRLVREGAVGELRKIVVHEGHPKSCKSYIVTKVT